MKTLWTGTDSLMLLDLSKRKLTKRPYWILFRLFARIIDFFCQEHYADSQLIADNLHKFGMKKKVSIFKDRVQHCVKYPKREHLEFNILYYFPEGAMEYKFLAWLYGRDIYEQVKEFFIGCNFIEVDGSKDMSTIYPVIDFYLRPNRHDGSSRIIQECEIQGIPYYHSNKNPDIEEIKRRIIYEYQKETAR